MQARDETISRQLPIGAEVHDDGTHFRVWAPRSATVAVELGEDCQLQQSLGTFPLEAEGNGYFSGLVSPARPGLHYKLQLQHGAFPDPSSRYQPGGPHAASRIIDPSTFEWSDGNWKGRTNDQRVLYELHVGTFTREGRWRAAAEQLATLADLGITTIEMMPVADFPGRYGWGYDGVSLFAPTRLYGEPGDLRHFINQAHTCGLEVILDVVYNHLGPDGNYLPEFSADYFSKRYQNEWGEPLNFDGENSGPVREYFLTNAAYWIAEFHFDGLRVDATQQIFDSSKEHIIAAISRAVRTAANGRTTYLVAENEPQQTRLVRSFEKGGYGMDALWNDDYHHSAIVALTGRMEAYYSDYRGTAQEFISAAKWGYLYQGQRYEWQKARRGTPSLELRPTHFVTFLENHDQVANSLWGKRLFDLGNAGRARALTALLLLGPGTPMLFQGQEFAASSPFVYFADHNPELAEKVAAGRAEFLRQFPSIASPEATAMLPDPENEETFLRCKLDFTEREKHGDVYRLHRDLLRLRKEDPLLGKAERGAYDGATLGERAFLLRFFGRSQDDRLLIVNLGPALIFSPAPEPLLAPPAEMQWELVWSSEDPAYGGNGITPLKTEEDNWRIPADAAALLVPKLIPASHESSDPSAKN
ncbi:malto-oligosyltrehalose trehalohydrolase [Chthoniobacter flavus Ellin428]|uniref:Malto-oligosyltrehalose trehalohydrolase n=1 Tax=Chthoniobacter flavus Ellin428 TaxID=497964 RepID=B4D2U3_9BACT|nr:malto-oligosyltrehalose trehalohydrolase [Chthoniobacter flavus]EDY19054.1 malto-oligosyltrehalose trehalohydrolase [Chthoniobacter flavus Ellin428]TCO86817.1 maltooligosyl trehalose hydrolase [Chthoniobacter flavus]